MPIPAHYQESLNRSLAFIENNLDRKMVLADIAREALLSEYHFHRIFKSLMGETVKDYTQRLKLLRSAHLLKHSQQEIGQLALASGYENHESFTRAFKAHFQLTPQQYRQQSHARAHSKQHDYQRQQVSLASLGVSAPVIKTLPDLHLAYVRHVGSYEQVAASFQQLMLWALRHLVLKLVPTTWGIVHDDPDLTQSIHLRFDACVQVTKPIAPAGRVGYKHVPGGRYAVFRYQGPYETFYEVYDYIYNVCVFEQNWQLADKPALELYVKSPPFYKPAQFVTDFCVPLK